MANCQNCGKEVKPRGVQPKNQNNHFPVCHECRSLEREERQIRREERKKEKEIRILRRKERQEKKEEIKTWLDQKRNNDHHQPISIFGYIYCQKCKTFKHPSAIKDGYDEYYLMGICFECGKEKEDEQEETLNNDYVKKDDKNQYNLFGEVS